MSITGWYHIEDRGSYHGCTSVDPVNPHDDVNAFTFSIIGRDGWGMLYLACYDHFYLWVGNSHSSGGLRVLFDSYGGPTNYAPVGESREVQLGGGIGRMVIEIISWYRVCDGHIDRVDPTIPEQVNAFEFDIGPVPEPRYLAYMGNIYKFIFSSEKLSDDDLKLRWCGIYGNFYIILRRVVGSREVELRKALSEITWAL